MEQGRPAKDAAVVKAWDEAKDKEEEEWEDRSLQGRAEIVYVRNVEQHSPTFPDNRVIKGTAQSAAQR